MGSCQWAEMAQKLGFLGAKVGEKRVETHLIFTHSKPISGFSRNPLLSLETFQGATGTTPAGPTPPAPTQLNPSAQT